MATSSESFSSHSPNIEEIDTKIESLKHQITLIQGEIRFLEEYKNTRLLTVAKLPPEVLSTILESLALSTPPRSTYRQEAYSHIFLATQVCRLWRQVALSSPRIWGCINGFASHRIVELFLERARSAPLYLWSPGYPDEKNVLAVLNHLERLKKIILKAQPNWVKRIVSEPTPQLEILSLETTSFATIDPFVFCADTFPSLQHLSLTGYVFKGNMTSPKNLRSLLIKPSDGPRQYSKLNHADPVNFFATLNDLPFLSSLTLIDALAPLNGSIPPLSVILPSLTHLLIQDDDISNLGMMSCITAPFIEVKLSHTGQANGETASPAIYSNLPDIPRSHSKLTLRTKVVSWSDRPGAHLQIWTGCVVEEQETDIPLFDLKVSGTGDLETEGWALTLCPSTTLPPILHFHSGVESFNYDSLATYRIFRQLKDVTQLHSDRLIDIILVLCDTPLERNEARSLPSLQKIVLGSGIIKYKQRMLSRLRKQLGARMAVEAGIEIWQLGPKCLPPSDLEQFSGIINLVEVPTRSETSKKPVSTLDQPLMW